jgi:hypothetical protein
MRSSATYSATRCPAGSPVSSGSRVIVQVTGSAGCQQWFRKRFFVLLCAQLLEEVEGRIFSYAAARTLWRRRSNPARPYMDRLMTFNRLISPSSAPGQRQGSMYGIAILTQAPGKALEAAGLSG